VTDAKSVRWEGDAVMTSLLIILCIHGYAIACDDVITPDEVISLMMA
jgi:hypothetical protein